MSHIFLRYIKQVMRPLGRD